MYRNIRLCLFLSFAIISTTSYSQNFDNKRFLIVFEAGTSAAEIQTALSELNCTEIWVSPISEVRLWQVNYFPYLYTPTNSTIYDINEETIVSRARPEVEEAGVNYEGEPIVDYNDAGLSNDLQMDCDGQLVTFTETDDNAVQMGVFDTGFTYPEFTQYADYYFDIPEFEEYDYINDDQIADDGHGHGTHVSSVIAHLTNKYTGLQSSLPPDVSYEMSKTFDEEGHGYLGEIIYAFEEAVLEGMQIANFSWSIRTTREEAQLSPLRHSLNTVLDEYEVLVVAAAGNNGADMDDIDELPNWPASYKFDKLLTVGTYDCSGDLTYFSNYGVRSIDVAAPGVNIPGLTVEGLVYKSGTSQSTAIVSGIAGILATHQTTFDAMDIKCAIITGSIPSADLDGKILSGGYVDAHRALGLLGDCVLLASDRSTNDSSKGTELYPNPTVNEIHLEFTSDADESINITILNSTGRVVQRFYNETLEGTNIVEINTADLTPGTYFLRSSSRDNNVNSSFIKL